jgi:hypothetical protein
VYNTHETVNRPLITKTTDKCFLVSNKETKGQDSLQPSDILRDPPPMQVHFQFINAPQWAVYPASSTRLWVDSQHFPVYRAQLYLRRAQSLEIKLLPRPLSGKARRNSTTLGCSLECRHCLGCSLKSRHPPLWCCLECRYPLGHSLKNRHPPGVLSGITMIKTHGSERIKGSKACCQPQTKHKTRLEALDDCSCLTSPHTKAMWYN